MHNRQRIDSKLLRKLLRLEESAARVRSGEVESLNPLRVSLGGSDTDSEMTALLGQNLVVGDKVQVLRWGSTGFVLGPVADPKIHAVGASGEPSFQNGWSSGFPAAAFYRVGGMVYLEGTITGGTQGSSAFILPAGFRPVKASTFAASRLVDDRGGIAVLTGGNVIVDHFASNSGIYLSPVHFRAA